MPIEKPSNLLQKIQSVPDRTSLQNLCQQTTRKRPKAIVSD
jgi:hypothetical protein